MLIGDVDVHVDHVDGKVEGTILKELVSLRRRRTSIGFTGLEDHTQNGK